LNITESGRGLRRILVLGLGGTGCSVVGRIAPHAPDGMEFAVMDCDLQTLETCGHIENGLDLGQGVTDGLSAGGDMETGRRCAEKAIRPVEALLSGVDLLLVVVGLGGGFGGGAAPVVARMARNAGAHTVFFTVFPFLFEGRSVRANAHSSLRRLRTYADAIIQMPNSRIQPDGDVLLEDSLDCAGRTLAAGVVGLWRLLTQTSGVCNLDFATLHTMLRHCDAACRFSCASADGENRAADVVESLRAHPLADGGAVFETAPGMIIGITGGDDLRLSEVRKILEEIAPDNEECWVKMGVASDPAFTGRLGVIVLAAEAWKEPLADDARRGPGELSGVLKPRSKAFGGAERTIWNGEDLDVPTFLRRKIKLPR
jgi:cell division protein FtsZ